MEMLGALTLTPVFPEGPDIGHGMRAHPWTCWLNNVALRYRGG